MACLNHTAALSTARVASIGNASSGRLRSADSEMYALCASFSRRCSTAAAVPTDAASSCRAPLTVSPVAKRVCDLTGKKRNNGYSVSFSNHRTKKLQQPNLQWKRVWWEAGQRYVRLKLSTKAIKTLEWKGLETMAKEAGLDLSKL